MEKKISKSLNKLDNVNHWISNCDTKSSFVLALFGIILTIIFTSNIGAEMVKMFSCEKVKSVDWQSIKYFICIISIIAFFVGIIVTICYIYMTLKGRINPNVYNQDGLNTDSNIFFGTISSKKFKDFERSTNDEADEKYLSDINSQTFINSNIANEKFKNYNKSLISMLITLSWFLLFIILK